MKKRRYGDDLYTRAELAKAIKKSKTTIRRWEDQGKLKPTINERGVRLYRASDITSIDASAVIEPLLQARAHVQTAAEAGGALSSEVFARLERGEGGVKIVTDLRVHPDVGEGLMKRWARFKRAIFLSREDIYAIEDALEMRVRELTAECLVDRIRRTAERMAKCARCKKERPYICSTCVSARIERCEWCKHGPKHVCSPCLDKCVRKALARHGITQEDDEEDDAQEGDDGKEKNESAGNDAR